MAHESRISIRWLVGEQPDIPAGTFALRQWRSADAPQLVAAFQDPAIRKWNLRELESVTEAEALIDAWKTGWHRKVEVSWAIVCMEAPSIVLGHVGFRSLFLQDRIAEVSYWVMEDRRRRGLATLAAGALARWGITQLALERIELVHSVYNPASCCVADRAGYHFEGVKRRLQQHSDGRRHDMCLHARIPDDQQEAGRPAGMLLRHSHRRTPGAVGPQLRSRRSLRRPPDRRPIT